jgi:hypothetical protein
MSQALHPGLLGCSSEHMLTLGTFQTAMQAHRPEIRRPDQGAGYAATIDISELQARSIQISMGRSRRSCAECL